MREFQGKIGKYGNCKIQTFLGKEGFKVENENKNGPDGNVVGEEKKIEKIEKIEKEELKKNEYSVEKENKGRYFVPAIQIEDPGVESYRPMNVYIIIDRSGSMDVCNKMYLAKCAAKTIVKYLFSRGKKYICI